MEYDKELASRLLTETMRELPGYLISAKAKEDDESFLTICALECFAEYHIRHLFYKKLLNMWPDKNYMHAKDLIADLITIGGKIEDDETTLKKLWRKADGHDVNMGKMFWRVEDSPYGIYLGFYDGFVEPLNFSYSSSYSAEAIFIMDDMSKSIWKRIPSVLPLLNMLDPDEIKKRQEEIKNKKKKMKDLKIFANNVEDAAVEMINQIAENEHFDNLPIRIMPDTHAGKGVVVGFTCSMGTHINPEHIGGDIGCGIETVIFDKILLDAQYALFEQRVRNEIPMGKNIHEHRLFDLKDFCKFIRKELDKAIQLSGGLVHDVPFRKEGDISLWCKDKHIDEKMFYKSIGTLGGGNHFIELDKNDSLGLMGITIHTGSRNLGHKVCNRWSKKAIATGGYLSGNLLSEYLTDMVIAQAYAKYNRMVILNKIAAIYKKMCKGKAKETISSVHNYIDFTDMMIRKGAIRSYEGERMVIPFNMRDGIAICIGKSNKDWNYSAPHGSGRIMSRNKAKDSISIEAFQQSMEGIFSTSVCPNTIDESPMAYKNTQEIISLIEPTCLIEYFMKPVINIKDTSDYRG